MLSYDSLEVDGKRNEDAAWHSAEPSVAASEIKGHVGFWKGADVK